MGFEIFFRDRSGTAFPIRKPLIPDLFLQTDGGLVAPRMRRHHHQKQPILPAQKIGKREKTFAFRRAQLAFAQEPAETAIGHPIRRIDEDVRRAVDEDEPAPDQELRQRRVGLRLEFVMRVEGAHDTRQRIAVGDADRRIAIHRRLRHELLWMRRPAQEGEIRRDPDFGEGGHGNKIAFLFCDFHANSHRARIHCAERGGIAENPGPAAFRILDAVVVAGWLRFLMPPPFHGDALWPFGMGDDALGMAPAHVRRVASRNRAQKAYRFGLCQQAQRPPRGFAGTADFFPGDPGLPSLLRGHRGKGVFGDMRVVRLEGEDALCAESCGETIDQETDLALRVQVGIEIGIGGFRTFGARRAETDEIEAEAGVERIDQSVELLAKQPLDDLGLAHGRAGLHRDAAHDAVGAEEGGFETSRALAAFLKDLRRARPRARSTSRG